MDLVNDEDLGSPRPGDFADHLEAVSAKEHLRLLGVRSLLGGAVTDGGTELNALLLGYAPCHRPGGQSAGLGNDDLTIITQQIEQVLRYLRRLARTGLGGDNNRRVVCYRPENLRAVGLNRETTIHGFLHLSPASRRVPSARGIKPTPNSDTFGIYLYVALF